VRTGFANAPAARPASRSCSDGGSGAGRSLPSEEGLRPGERIRQECDYRQVIRKGRLITGQTFKAYFLISDRLDRKAGFIAGKHVGNAVFRNRAKRLLKETYRLLKNQLPACGFRVVFVARSKAATSTLGEIRNEMVWMFEECGLLKSA
jgi:ribonuclease P protein component